MHKILERQLRRAFGSVEAAPHALKAFLEAVDGAYADFEADAALRDRSLALTSQELLERNQQLREELAVRERDQALLSGQRRQFLELIERLPYAVALVRGTELVFVNPAAVKLLRLERAEQLLGPAALGLLEPQARLETIARAEQRDFRPVVHRVVRPDGEVLVIEVTPVQELDFDGAPALLLLAADLTEREKLQQRLLFSGRMASLGTLASGVAHEINNPLAFVLANVGFVLEELQGPPLTDAQRAECVKALTDVEEGAKRVQRIVRDLRTFSRAEEERRGPVDLHALLEGSLAVAQNELKHRARLVRQLEPVPAVIADASRLGQVFLNLLLNAAHALPEGEAGSHEVRVRTRLEPRGAIIEVEDTGSGMTPEVRKRIFDPFFTTKPQGEGTGLGLSICHGIITGLGGDIEVETEPGKGSTFRVVLPPSAAVTAPQPPAAPARAPSRRGKVLVIDDEELVCSSVRRTLGAEHDVDAATRVADALARFDAGARYDVILCDVMMPELSGMDLLHALEQRAPSQARRVVFLTGGAFAPKAVAFLATVQNVVLEKPYAPKALRALVRERVSANG